MTKKEDNKPSFVKRDSMVTGKEYAQLLSMLKERYRKSQIKAAVKVNLRCWNIIGRWDGRYHVYMNLPNGEVRSSIVLALT